jgi:hypothetical protein
MGRESTTERPSFPHGYGISTAVAGMLDWDWATERLAASRNYWIVTSGPDGRPHAMPVWGIWHEDGVVFSTSAQSRKGRNLARDRRVVVHLESGDEVVIIEGEVETLALDDVIGDAFAAKYDWRPDVTDSESPWYTLRPRIGYAWRERDYPTTATRFRFGRSGVS